MKVTYIHHSSFLVELEQVSLLFDYFEGELPENLGDKPLVVFVSHRHGDHFSPVIFDLQKRVPEIRYVLSDDIWNNRVPEELHARTLFMGPDEKRELTLPGVKQPLVIETFRSTDEGVAFLIEAEGKTIYHAGDLNDWVWAGEPEADNKRMHERYLAELDKMAGKRIDVAFMLIDPRQEHDCGLGMDEFMRRVGADVVFPMHFWNDFTAAGRFKAKALAAPYRDKIREIERRGQSFTV